MTLKIKLSILSFFLTLFLLFLIGYTQLFANISFLIYDNFRQLDITNKVLEDGVKIIGGVELYIILAFSSMLTIILFYKFKGYLLDLILFFLLIFGGYYIGVFLLNIGYYLDFKLLFLSIIFAYIFELSLNIFLDNKEKKLTKILFSRYVNKNVVDKIINDGVKPVLTGENREVSILFSDLEGFTSLSEKVSPQELISIINKVFSSANKIILNNSGTLNKYIGDSVMAFWGAPVFVKNHAELAVYSALEIIKDLERINKENNYNLSLKIGINTGNVIVGNVGDESFCEYTIMGDSVNLASRLEGVNQKYNTKILISHTTYTQLSSKFLCKKIDEITVKGKTKSTIIYEVLGIKD